MRPRASIKMMPAELEKSEALAAPAELMAAAPGATIIYMNRHGGTFTPGREDSRKDRSAILDQTATIEPWDPGEDAWSEVMTCVRAQFAPFAVEVTDVDPGPVPHVESVVAGLPEDLGFKRNVGGVSPFTSDCRVISNPIVFTFAEALPEKPQVVCEIVAQEVAHSFGLDHEFLCEDPMSYLGGCGKKTFQNVSAPCGEHEARPCRVEGRYDCGAETQNSYAKLVERIGPRAGGPAPPSLSIVSPADGETVSPGFRVLAEASSVRGDVAIDLRIDGVEVGTMWTAPFELIAPDGLESGTYIVELIARDGVGETSESIAVHVEADGCPGQPDGDCNAGLLSGCNASGGEASLVWALLVAALVIRRRRPGAAVRGPDY
jgi:uncharacterized protein (TIGR03382 family)